MFPDRDIIDLYLQNTESGQIITDLGDTYGWLFINGANEELTSKQEQTYNEACTVYGVERQNGTLFIRVVNDNLIDPVIRLAQTITVVSHALDVGQPDIDL